MLFSQKFEVLFFFQILQKNSPIYLNESQTLESADFARGVQDVSGLKNPKIKFLNARQQFLFYQKLFKSLSNVVFLRVFKYTDYFVFGFVNFETFQNFFLKYNYLFQQHNLIFSEVFLNKQAFYLNKISKFFKKPNLFFKKTNIPCFFYQKSGETLITLRSFFYNPIFLFAFILKLKNKVFF